MELITEIERDRPAALPLPYALALVIEVTALGALAATTTAGRPPWSYEVGWLGTASMVAMQLYSLRRRVRALRALGSLRAWLDLHVFLGLQGFVLVAYHSVGVSPSASLAALNFALVATLVVTGVFGRYLYVWIPRARLAAERARAALPISAADRARALATRIRWLARAERGCARWILLHRPVAFLLLAITAMHALAHFAYAA